MNETRGQFTHSDLLAPPTDPSGPAVSIAGVATFGTLSGSPTGRRTSCTRSSNNLSHQARRARASRRASTSSTTTPPSPFPRSRPRQLRVLVARQLPAAASTTTRASPRPSATPSSSQTNPNVGFYVQDEWKVQPAPDAECSACATTSSSWRPIATDTNNVSPRAGFAWTPFASRRTVVRGSFGLFYDRVPLRALANALLVGGNTTDLTPLSQISISLSPTQAGAPVFPNILTASAARRRAGQLHHHGPQHAERLLRSRAASKSSSRSAQRGTLQRRLSAPARPAPDCLDQSERAHLRRRRHQQRLPPESRTSPTTASTRSLADSHYDGLHLSFMQRARALGQLPRLLHVLESRSTTSANSSSARPSTPSTSGATTAAPMTTSAIASSSTASLNSPRAARTTSGSTSPTASSSSAILQYYSALPLNITTGATTIQGTAARPTVNGEFIERNAGIGQRFVQLNLRLSRIFALDRTRPTGSASPKPSTR